MSASRVDLSRPPRTLALAVLACLAGPLAGTAWGQGLPPSPLTLIPRDILGSEAPAAPVAPPEQAGLAPGTATPGGPEVGGSRGEQGGQGGQGDRGIQGIEINPLAEIAPDAIGILGAEDGGFGIDMWRGTPREVIEGLLRHLPTRMSSRAMRDLTRRLLLSVAPPPAAKPRALASAAPAAQGFSAGRAATPARLLILRSKRLAELGEIPALVELLSVVPGHVEEESLDRLHVEALFLGHDRDEACRRVRNGIALYHELAFWQKAMAFCNMAGGDLDRGMLGLDLLREQGMADDPLFFALAARFIGVEEALPPADSLSPLHVAMLRAAGAPFPAAALERAAPGLLYAIATAPNATPAMRAAAAERACAQGIVGGGILARGYDAMSFAPDRLDNAIGAAAELAGTAARAVLYQAARRETLPAPRAEILRVALDAAAARADLYPAAVEIYGPLIAEIDPTPRMVWFTATAGRALYGAGRHPRAGAWLALGRQEAIIDPQASAAVAALWPYSRLAGGEALATNGDLETWHAMREAAGAAPPAGSTALLRGVFQALGELDPMTWSEIAARAGPAQVGQAEGDPAGDEPTGRAMPDAAFLHALEDASEARRVGETVLLALILLGEAGPAGAHNLALGSVVSGLSRIGLEREARALAIEAALGNGV